nr:uncharacterized protein LOC102128961 [Macaca fascicularis]
MAPAETGGDGRKRVCSDPKPSPVWRVIPQSESDSGQTKHRGAPGSISSFSPFSHRPCRCGASSRAGAEAEGRRSAGGLSPRVRPHPAVAVAWRCPGVKLCRRRGPHAQDRTPPPAGRDAYNLASHQAPSSGLGTGRVHFRVGWGRFPAVGGGARPCGGRARPSQLSRQPGSGFLDGRTGGGEGGRLSPSLFSKKPWGHGRILWSHPGSTARGSRLEDLTVPSAPGTFATEEDYSGTQQYGMVLWQQSPWSSLDP